MPLAASIHGHHSIFAGKQNALFELKEAAHMKRDVTIKQIIETLKKYPPDATVTLLTKNEVEIVGFVLRHKDGSNQIAHITPAPKETAKL
jgi:hypothetical protein